MSKKSKRIQYIVTRFDKLKVYSASDAIKLLADFASKTGFKESVDVAVKLGVDAKKSDQVIRGAAVLPHGTGKTNRVAVFADAGDAREAENAGADLVGFTPTYGYEFDNSLGLAEKGVMMGIAIDDVNQVDQTPHRMAEWVTVLLYDFGFKSA